MHCQLPHQFFRSFTQRCRQQNLAWLYVQQASLELGTEITVLKRVVDDIARGRLNSDNRDSNSIVASASAARALDNAHEVLVRSKRRKRPVIVGNPSRCQ